MHKPFLVIEENLKGMQPENPSLEPTNSVGLKPQNGNFETPNPILLGLVTDVRTAVLESEYDYTLNVNAGRIL
jgi:hypothetical protein